MKRENKYCKPSVKKRNGGRGDEKYEALKKKTSFAEAEAFPESCEHPRQPEYEPGGRRDDHNGGWPDRKALKLSPRIFCISA